VRTLAGDSISTVFSKPEYITWLFSGLAGTIIISLVGTFVGLILGILLAFGKNIEIHKKDSILNKLWKYPLKYLCILYSVVIRGTPMMVQALIFQSVCLLIGINWYNILHDVSIFNGSFIAGLIIITFNTAAYMGEIVQSGINGVSKDQSEGGRSLGLTKAQTLFSIVLPQALRNAIPTIGNEWIVNIKDSSVLNVISVTELFFEAKIIASNTYAYLGTYLVIALFYLALTLLVTLLLKFVTFKMDHKKFNFRLLHFRQYNTKGDVR
jgi:putative lysine transport system permease protein